MFKHKIKKTFLTSLKEKDKDIHVYYGKTTAIVTLFKSWDYNTNRNIGRVIFPCFNTTVFAFFKFKTLIFILKG